MHVVITVGESAGGLPELGDLGKWLSGEDELRGRVTALRRPPVDGELGLVADVLQVALAPGGAAMALTTALITWIRHRSTKLSIKLTHADGSTTEIDVDKYREKAMTQLAEGIVTAVANHHARAAADGVQPRIEIVAADERDE